MDHVHVHVHVCTAHNLFVHKSFVSPMFYMYNALSIYFSFLTLSRSFPPFLSASLPLSLTPLFSFLPPSFTAHLCLATLSLSIRFVFPMQPVLL